MKVKLIAIIAVLVAGVATLVSTLSGYMNTEEQYMAYLSKARHNAEREIPYTSYQNYRRAMAIKNEDESIYLEFVAQAELLGEDFYMNALTGYVQQFPMSATAYDMLCQYYYDMGSYSTVITTALEAREKGVATTNVRDLYIECCHMLRTIQSEMEEAQTFLGNTALAKKGGLYGYVSDAGLFEIAPMFEGGSSMMNGNAAVNDGEEWYMMNSQGFKVARTSIPVDEMSFLSGGWIRFKLNGKYGYMDANLNVPETVPYDYAGNFKNGVAAVKKGDKWALVSNTVKEINDKWTQDTSYSMMITGYDFDDVLLDEYDACINGGVIFAKLGGKYYMFDAEGRQISSQGFDEAYPFMGTQPAAVRIGDKWGFVNTSGEIVIEPKYEGAKSFSIGLGAVKENGTWGYINSNGEYRIESQYEDCKPFAANGIAAVYVEGFWQYVKLLAYYN